MLENATRICEAKFGTLFLFEARGSASAPCTARRRLVEVRQARRTGPSSPDLSRFGRVAATKQVVHIADVRGEQPTAIRDPCLRRQPWARWRADRLAVPMLKDNELVGAIVDLPPGGAALHRQADRAGAELRRPGRHRHREHAAAQRAAPEISPGAADRDVRGAQGHQRSPAI